MRFILILSTLFLITACHGATTIDKLRLPQPSSITGTVENAGKGEFVLREKSGAAIKVDLDDFPLMPPLKNGEMVTVKGVVDEDDSMGKGFVVTKEFDAFSIKREGQGEIFIVPYDKGQR